MATSKKIRFVILAVPRSGSNMLATLLNSHPKILCHHELFNPNGIFYALNLRNTEFQLGTIEKRDKAPITFLNKVWQAPLSASHIGLKMTYKQNKKAFYALLSDTSIRKIILKRENSFKTYISHKIAEKTNQWEVYRQQDLICERPQIKVDLQELMQRIAFDNAHYQEIETYLKNSNQVFCETKYECLNQAEERRKLLNFLSIKEGANELKIHSIKQNSDNWKLLVENWEVLAEALEGTSLEKYLE